MNELVLAGLLGGVGGLTRGVVGLLKVLASEKENSLELWSYWAITVTILTDKNNCTIVVSS